MKFKMPYQNTSIDIELPKEKILAVLSQQEVSPITNPHQAILDSLKCPVNTLPLSTLINQEANQNIVIIVNDITRPTPYKLILPPLLTYIESLGIKKEQITLLIATGIHRPNTKDENIQSFGKNIVENYKIENHNPDNNLEKIGVLSDGQELYINKTAANADFLITTGQINLHYFAGFSGGRKSILPGIASRKLITENHARMNEPGSESGNVTSNPVNKTMLEAAKLAQVDFNINVVINEHKEILQVFAGDLEASWVEGVKLAKSISTISIKEKADVTIVSAGGYPKDINLYQAQKAIENAALATNANGYIILFAACQERFGESKFEEWIMSTKGWLEVFDRFNTKFELGGHKAFALARSLYDKNLLIITEMNEKHVNECNMIKVQDFNHALTITNAALGNDWQCYIMQEGSSVLPILGK